MSSTFQLDTATSRANPTPAPMKRLTVPAIKRRKLRTSLIARHLAANPDADALSENKLRGKTFKPSPEVDVSNVPDFGGTLRVPENLLHAQLYAHYGNQARLKQFRRGQVIIRVCYRFCIYSCV